MNLTKDWLFSFNQYFLGSMKRLLILRDNEPPAKKTHTDTETSDRGRDDAQNDTKLDLVYPFTDASGGGSGGGGSTGQTISVARPLVMSNNTISLQYASPLFTSDGTLTLNADTSTFVTRNGLALRIDGAGGLTTSENGIGIVKNTGPIVVGSSGISISTNNSLQVAANKLGISVAPSAPFITTNGLDLNYDFTTMQIADRVLKVKLDPVGPIVPSSNGLFINLNTDDFEVSNRIIRLKSRPTYVSPYTTLTVGNKNLVTYSGQAASDQNGSQRIWNVAYYVFMVESAGLVNGIIDLGVTDERISGTGSSATSGLNFTFVVCMDGTNNQQANLSQISVPTTSPAGRNSRFYPLEFGGTYIGLPPVSPNSNWYRGPSTAGLLLTKFYPFATVTTFAESSMGTAPATVQTINRDYTRNILGRVIMFTFALRQTSTENWFERPTGKTLTTGPLSFSYQASSQNVSETTTE